MRSEVLKSKRPALKADAGLTPASWRVVAGRLLAGARLIAEPLMEGIAGRQAPDVTPEQKRALVPKVDLFECFFLLASFAVENELKARIVERALAAGQTFTTIDDVMKLFTKKRGGHDIEDLARLAAFVPTPGEAGLLHRLTHFAHWAARYPTPRKRGDAIFERTTRDRDLTDIEALIAKIRANGPNEPAAALSSASR
jgi:hypothetical protein